MVRLALKARRMPRPTRLDLPGLSLHVVQRGNDRKHCFFADRDYLRYLECLGELLDRFSCQLHAYVLMTNHVHLLLTPSEAGAVSRLMQSLGRQYVGWVNASRERSGTLWEGRFKSCPVDGARYALACTRYIELNPVRAGMVAHPSEYRWSSFACNALGRIDALITTHPALQELAIDPITSRERYRDLVESGLQPAELESLRLHAARQRAWGSEEFAVRIEAALGRPARIAKRGRPARNVTEELLL
jgi:putative transposase